MFFQKIDTVQVGPAGWPTQVIIPPVNWRVSRCLSCGIATVKSGVCPVFVCNGCQRYCKEAVIPDQLFAPIMRGLTTLMGLYCSLDADADAVAFVDVRQKLDTLLAPYDNTSFRLIHVADEVWCSN